MDRHIPPVRVQATSSGEWGVTMALAALMLSVFLALAILLAILWLGTEATRRLARLLRQMRNVHVIRN